MLRQILQCRQTASYNHLKVLTSGQAQAQHQYFLQYCTGICVSVNQEKPIYDLYQLVSLWKHSELGRLEKDLLKG